jgi:predicted amidohydrolase
LPDFLTILLPGNHIKLFLMQSNLSRRKFLGNASLGLGAIGIPDYMVRTQPSKDAIKTPHYINVGTVSIMDLSATSTPDMVQKVLSVMEEMVPFQPDIICLPEVFAFTNIPSNDYQLKDVAEKAPGPVVTPFLNFAKRNKCYVIVPTYTLHEGNIFISAVLVDRQGKVAGEYHKMRPAESELKMGIKPGKSEPPVFQTDFGKIGIQICFDIKYEEGWNYLKDKGAQIIFWPSAYAAGQEISSRAWRHQVYVVSSTQKDTSKICDITGETIAQTGRWQRNWICAPVNLEKAFIYAWPSVSVFPDIQKKYGSRIKLTTYSEEEWTIIESLDADLKVADVLKEFNLKTSHDVLKDLSVVHEKARDKA